MKIKAPISGLLVPLELVPDDAFSQKIIGDGVSIDPTDNVLYSPIDAVIDYIHPSQHALTLKTSDDMTLLIHIGVDSVQLKGEGFKSFVKVGQKVKTGDKLIEFDLDFISTKAKSLLTQILITDAALYNINFTKNTPAQVNKNSTLLFEVQKISNSSLNSDSLPEKISIELKTEVFTCSVDTGLHARPAGAIAQLAKKYSCELFIVKNNKKSNAKSLISILGLAIEFRDKFYFVAQGQDAAIALKEMTQLINTAFASNLNLTPQNTAPTKSADTLDQFSGVMASPGLVLGSAFQIKQEVIQVQEALSTVSASAELKKLTEALDKCKTEIQQLINNLRDSKNTEQITIFEAHLEILNDPELFEITLAKINSGHNAAFAWQQSAEELKKIISSVHNEIIAARAHDLHDVSQRVLRALLGLPSNSDNFTIPFTNTAILIARNLTPSDMVRMDLTKVKGICTVEGGASSHVAIIARSMGLAYLVAVHESILNIETGTEIILNSKLGFLKTQPTAVEKNNALNEIQKQNKQDILNIEFARAPATTLDQETLKVFANVGQLGDAQEALKYGAEGIGLLRSEFLFLHRATAPSELEQQDKYQDILNAIASQNSDNTLIIRTLDVGGDKPLSYLPLPSEENPFLGVRGLRLSLKSPEIFRSQLRAILKVKPLTSIQIMFPMVTTLSELLIAKNILAEECLKLNVTQPSVGIMIEVPSAALLAEAFAPHVDFFSIGSNDLTQYTLAIDRGHRDLAVMADGLHPSVLKLIHITCKAAQKYNKMVGVCGGIAGDPYAVPVLIGLGVHELSVSVPVIPNIKAQIRKLTKSECVRLAEKSLQLAEAHEVRKLVEHLI